MTVNRPLRVVAEGELAVSAPRRRSAKDIVPFGQYKGANVSELLADLPYCSWLIEQQWCRNKFPEIMRAAKAAVAVYEQSGGEPSGDASTTPVEAWAALTVEQRIAVQVCAPTLASALGAP